jgi:hypothetical protein
MSIKKSLVFGCVVLLTALLFITGCTNPSSSDIFVPVTDITGVPAAGTQGAEVDLGGATVVPADASYKTISWSVKDAGTTGLSAEGIVNAKFTPAKPGTLVLTATIAKGKTEETDYAKDFTITISPQPAPSKPVIASVVPASTTSLTVTWGSVLYAASYELYYSTDSTSPTSATEGITANVSITGATATITGLTQGTVYYIWVRAKNNTGTSEYSAAAGCAPFVIPGDLGQYFQSLPYSAAYAYYDDGFAVDSTAKTFYYYSDSTFTTKWGGPIVNIVSDTSGAYIMIVKLTEVTGSWNTPPELGKYFACAYKNLTSSAVNSNTAYKSSGENTGTTTIAEAISEYTVANGYFDYLSSTLYYPHTTSAATLASLQGNWVTEDLTEDPDYFIQISGTKLTEWLDDGDGAYDSTNDASMLGELGDIVDSTDSSRNSGVLYVKIIASDGGFTDNKYIAVGWKDKTPSSVRFMTNTTEYANLADVKAALYDANDESQFDPDGFYDYTK